MNEKNQVKKYIFFFNHKIGCTKKHKLAVDIVKSWHYFRTRLQEHTIHQEARIFSFPDHKKFDKPITNKTVGGIRS